MQTLQTFTTCPPGTQASPAAWRRQLQEAARSSEEAGCEGMLVVTDNAQPDPWLVSQLVIEATERLSPLVAVQPAYMHPYSVAKMVSTLAGLHGRRVHLNLVAGGFKNDLAALNDQTPHDERYARLLEYAAILQGLLGSPQALSFEGRYYKVANLKLAPALPAELMPGFFVSGSSAAGMEAARALRATAVEYPKPPAEQAAVTDDLPRGMRIGIIARTSEDEAWAAALARYPEDRKGQLAHELAMKVSDSVWHRQLSALAREAGALARPAYWLVPFQNYKAVCPFLVGSYARVAEEMARYAAAGYRSFILDAPAEREELRHIGAVLERAARQRLAA
jgi:alkanesulfonate monooxygenase